MKKSELRAGRERLPLISLNTLIIGGGAAALNAAVSLAALGQTDIALACERLGGGTSFEAGSDKQTYYKLSLSGGEGDSPSAMARDLIAGGGMHGDIALCEAAGSARAFFRLVELGVPFPQDPRGEFPGYKTDHDPRQRATSAGPLTSRFMAEALAREARRRRIRVFDRHPVISLLTGGKGDGKRTIGAVALDQQTLERDPRAGGFVIFNAVNIVLATGGPGGLYEASVYPESQTGSHGLAFEIGALGQNLGEWQFGLASIKPRWNLSGTYQQAVPRYFSTDRAGRGEREFLSPHFPGAGRLATAIFMKGYEWPFDPRKVAGFGSSLIDLLVHRETAILGRRVFLDYRRNPEGLGRGGDFGAKSLSPEAFSYLDKSGALLPTPIERLKKMNPPALELFRSRGLDLARHPLEAAVCAQHNNGGLRGGLWWESNIAHLFPVGEANGTHGVSRPGGSALNAGQVGSFRAAQFIAKRYAESPPSPEKFREMAGPGIAAVLERARAMIRPGKARTETIETALGELRRRMTSHAAHVRDPKTIEGAVEAAWRQVERLRRNLRVRSKADWARGFRALDLSLTQAVYLEAVREYLSRGGRSRGSYLVLDPAGKRPAPTLGDEWRFALASPSDFASRRILETRLDEDGRIHSCWAGIRPIPADESWFETVWADFRGDRIVR